MDNRMYEMIFKRKSFHLFRNVGDLKILSEEIELINKNFRNLIPLYDDIKVDIKIVEGIETTCKRNEEYCILLYSEKKGNYLQNIGYLGEQLDLLLTSMDIGVLWFGIGKPDQLIFNDLDFVIMLAIKKVPTDKFRNDMFKSKRKDIKDIWIGEKYQNIANIVRFAPSACNTQPWKVEEKDNVLLIYRYKDPFKRGIMPIKKVSYYNKIDIGIFLLFLELCIENNKIKYNKELIDDLNFDDSVLTLVAKYYLN